MSGKLVGLFIILASIAVGGGVYYAQVYGYYEEVALEAVELTTFQGSVEPILFEDFEAIDADSSPIRYRACFKTPMSLALLTETYQPFEDAEPLNAPPWFDCFVADKIAKLLDNGNAIAFTGEANFEFGIDRVVAITEDGQGYVWHQVNECGDKLYDGSPAGENCPEKDSSWTF